MNKKDTWEYLSDQELDQLILLVEQEGLIPAPPDLEEGIVSAIRSQGRGREAGVMVHNLESDKENDSVAWSHKSQKKELEIVVQAIRKKSPEEKRVEFYSYCLRVLTSVAAAILLVFSMPELAQVSFTEFRQESGSVISQNYYAREGEVKRNQTGFARKKASGKQQSVPTREEFISDRGIFQKVFGNRLIFSGNGDEKFN